MEKREPAREELVEENRELKERLSEAEETIRAIQSGEVDALVIYKPDGEHLYTLTGADHGYRVLVESISEGALILSSEDSIYYCNRALGEMLGRPAQKIVSRKLGSYVVSEARTQLRELIEEGRGLGAARGEFLMQREDGALLPVCISLNRLRIEDFEGICAVITDLSEQKMVEEELRRHRAELEFLVKERTADLEQEIAERKRMEEALRESEERLRLLGDNLPESALYQYVHDSGGKVRFVYLSAGIERLNGVRAEDVLRNPGTLHRQVLPEYFERLVEKEAGSAREMSDFDMEVPMRLADGRVRWMRLHSRPRRMPDGGVIWDGVQIDVTERKRMEEELLKSRDELELRVRDRTEELAEVNRALLEKIEERKLAEEAVKAKRQLFYDVLETLPVYVCLLTPDYHVPFANRVFRERFGESTGLRCFVHLFGRSEPCEVCETYKVLETGTSRQWDWTGPDGLDYSVFDFPFTDTDGSDLILEMGIDVTERKRAEAELKETVVKLEQLNQELQEFAFIASHDLQEPLRKIQTFGELLVRKNRNSLNAEGQDYIERIIKGANRMSELLRALLDYSRSGTSHLDHKPVSLTEVAREAASDLENRIKKVKGKIVIGELPTVDADASLMRQLFQNIIGNSIKYGKESEPPFVRIHGVVDGSLCRVFFEDNGIGFDECYSEQIFKPFERLHGKNSPYRGTGMGLAICRKIAARHGGDITANSAPGQGATFVVTLPTVQRA